MKNSAAFQLNPAVSSRNSVKTPDAVKANPKTYLRTIFTMSDAFMHLSELTKRAGFDFFLVGHPPEEGCRFESTDLLLSNLPLFVTEDLVALNLLTEWDVMDHFQETSAPFVWSQDNGVEKDIDELDDQKTDSTQQNSGAGPLLAQQLNINFAHCLPAATKGKRRAFLMLFSCNEEIGFLDPSLFLDFQRLFDQIETLTSQRSRNTSHDLNDREIECLRWAAAGKTSSEIATIVSLSEHTINHYLNSSCRKMDCVNRTQAVAKAIRHRMIQ